MGRMVLARSKDYRNTVECTASIIYDDQTQTVTDVEVANSLLIPVNVVVTDPRDGWTLSRTIQPKTVFSLPAGARGNLGTKALRRIPMNSTEAREWTAEQLAAVVQVQLFPVEG